MAKDSAKKAARELFRKNPRITPQEIYKEIDGRVSERTIQKYLSEFRKQYRGKTKEIDMPTEISMQKLEKELALQLEINPTSAVIKSCIDYLKLKQSTDDKSKEIDITKFLKIGKNLLKGE